MRSETSDPTGYVVRFGFDQRTVLVVVGCLAFVALSIWLPLDGGDLWRLPPQIMWAVKVAGVLLFGVGGLVFAIGVARGGVALSVDRQGVELGNPRIPQPGMTNRPVHVAWDQAAGGGAVSPRSRANGGGGYTTTPRLSGHAKGPALFSHRARTRVTFPA